MVLASAFDQSKYLRAEDITQEKTLRIKTVTEELVGVGADQEKKLVVSFTNSQKGLVLNRTNNRTIRSAYGDDTMGWAGKLVVVFQTHADFRGHLVPALRVRIPPPKQASGNGQTAPQPTPVQQTRIEQFADASPTRPIPIAEAESDDFDETFPL
jgi:hypothetical protein